MRQREFERRVKGIVDQPRRRPPRENSHPGRSGPALKVIFAVLCVAVLVLLTANGSRYFAFHRDASRQAVQVTEVQAVARVNAAPAIAAPAHAVPRGRHHQGDLASAAAAHHAALRRHTKGVMSAAASRRAGASGRTQAAATSAADDSAQLPALARWVRTAVRTAITPVLGADAAESAADTAVLHLPVLGGAGVFLIVMLLLMSLGSAIASRGESQQGIGV